MQSVFCPPTGEPRDAMWQSAQAMPLECEPVVIGKFASGCAPPPAPVHAVVVWQSAHVCANALWPETLPTAVWKSALWQPAHAVGVPG
jgi:hypothetical protein